MKEGHCSGGQSFSVLFSTSSVKVTFWSRYGSKGKVKVWYEAVDASGCYRVIDLVDEAFLYGPYGVTLKAVNHHSDKKYRYYGGITAVRLWSGKFLDG